MTAHFSTAAGRRELRTALLARHPWLTDTDVGPAAVEAGECDRCAVEPRMVMTCGPVAWTAIGRQCAAVLGESAWCDGHAADAAQALTALRQLPAEADVAARLWWVATGEVQVDPQLAAAWQVHALAPGQ